VVQGELYSAKVGSTSSLFRYVNKIGSVQVLALGVIEPRLKARLVSFYSETVKTAHFPQYDINNTTKFTLNNQGISLYRRFYGVIPIDLHNP